MKSKEQILNNYPHNFHSTGFTYDEMYVLQAMEEYRTQPPSKEVWIEKDAVKEPPEEEGEYFVTYTNDIGRQFDGTMIYSFECGWWDIQKGFRVISYLVKQSQPVLDERTIKNMAEDYALSTSHDKYNDAGLKGFIVGYNAKHNSEQPVQGYSEFNLEGFMDWVDTERINYLGDGIWSHKNAPFATNEIKEKFLQSLNKK